MNDIISKKPSRTERFVDHVFDRCKKDKGMAARLRRATNPDTEHHSWEFLAQWVNLEYSDERLPFALIASAIAIADVERNGNLELGQAIALCYKDNGGHDNDAAKAKLRRLLSCSDVPDVCRVLRSMLSLINSRASGQLDYVYLLNQLLKYHFDDGREGVRARWAQEFYGNVTQADDQEAA